MDVIGRVESGTETERMPGTHSLGRATPGRSHGPRYPLEGCVNGRDESGTETEQLPS